MSKRIELYNLLKGKIGEEGTIAIIDAIDEVAERAKSEMATKADLMALEGSLKADLIILESKIKTDSVALEGKMKAEMAALEGRLNERITTLEGRLNERITTEVSRLEQKLSETKADITKWMFLFWIGQIAAMILILRAFVK
ncbi:MAG: DUF1640 domain-containing protein [Nitrospirae bacterium]|nr:DUF1640 domain-containing protein [Nitrospirota bacterium]MBF0590962.1 DUF1640 domain-containing protein [Nitrospirota bacterium]